MTNDSLVDVCNTRAEADYVIAQLRGAGFDMKKLSMVGRNHHDDKGVIGSCETGERRSFTITGVGPISAAGPLVAAIVSALEQTVAVGGLNAFGVGLYNLGVPQNSIRTYETALKQDKLLIIAHGSSEEVQKARDILGKAVAL